MKKIFALVAAIAALLFTNVNASAQTPEQKDFLGKWELTVSGLPNNGNLTAPLTISFEDNALKGSILTPQDEKVTFDTVSVEDDVLVAEFEAEGFVVNLELSLEEDGTLSGYLMNAFSVKGKKAAEKK
ncbi:MAG: hypothetical protein IJG35_02780 [Bacteroidales bacterium]|nr:hypothetical protein [Bacteroidales bacterium]